MMTRGTFDSLLSENDKERMSDNDDEVRLSNEGEEEMGVGNNGVESYVFSLLVGRAVLMRHLFYCLLIMSDLTAVSRKRRDSCLSCIFPSRDFLPLKSDGLPSVLPTLIALLIVYFSVT